MKFDSNLAWKQASSAVAANRDVLLALAGVFYLLPSLVLALLFPQPEPLPDASQEAMMAIVRDYYVSIMPIVIPIVLFQAVGTLAMLTLFTDRSRPTVGDAIKLGVQSIVPYIVAQLILGLGIGLIGGLVLAISSATGSAAITAVGMAAVFGLLIYLMIRTSLVGPVIAVENQRNPIEALKRSWNLSKINTARIGLFYLLVLIAFLVVILIITLVTAILVALVAGPHATQVSGAVIGSAMNAVMALYFVAIIAAVHRQLAGPSAQAERVPFE